MNAMAMAALRALALALGVGAALTALRWKRPQLRLDAWTLVLAAALAMPLLSRLLPPVAWHLPLAPLATHIASTSATAGPAPAPLRFLPRDAKRPGAASARAGYPSRRTAPGLPSWFLPLYLAGVAWLLLRGLLGWRCVRRLRAAATPITDVGALARLRFHAAGRQTPQLAQAEALTVPLTVGVRRPAILLPPGWRGWSGEQFEAVLAHEAAHVLRRDTLRLGLSLLHRALFWFSPLPWWLHRKLGELAEQASDEAALAAGAEPAAYAGMLLGFMSALGPEARRARWQAVAMARGGSCSRRLETILAWRRHRRPRPGLRATLVVCALPLAGLAAALRLTAVPAPLAMATRPAPSPALRPARLASLAPPATAPATAAPAPDRAEVHATDGDFAWMRPYVGQLASQLSQDSQFNALLAATAPDASFHLGVDRPLSQALAVLLRGTPSMVTLRAGRYLSFSASSPGDRLALAWLWMDLERGASFGAIVFNPSNGEPTPSLTFFTRQAGVYAPPPEALRDFQAWAVARALPAPLSTYFIAAAGDKTALLHAPDDCASGRGGGFDSRLCQALNLDQANADMTAGLYLLRRHLGLANPAALAELDRGQQAWLAQRDRACGPGLADVACRARVAQTRAQALRAALDGAEEARRNGK